MKGSDNVWHPTWTYGWKTSAWGACSKQCGTGTQTRTKWCQRLQDNFKVPDEFCSGITAPAISQNCNTQACFTSVFGTTSKACKAWNTCHGYRWVNIEGQGNKQCGDYNFRGTSDIFQYPFKLTSLSTAQFSDLTYPATFTVSGLFNSIYGNRCVTGEIKVNAIEVAGTTRTKTEQCYKCAGTCLVTTTVTAYSVVKRIEIYCRIYPSKTNQGMTFKVACSDSGGSFLKVTDAAGKKYELW